MKLTNPVHRYDTPIVVHDHFDGSARCVECEGECVLTGADAAYTALVRTLFEAEALHGQGIAYMAIEHMRKDGIDVEKFKRRAADTMRPIRRRRER